MTSATLTSLAAVQGAIRRKQKGLESAAQSLRDLLQGAPTPTEPNTLNQYIQDLEVQIATVTTMHKEFDSYMIQFENHAAALEGNQYEAELDNISAVSNSMIALIAKGTTVVARTNKPRNAAGADEPDHQQQFQLLSRFLNQLETRDTGPDQSVKLPFIPLPKFRGDVINWKPFWDRFEAAVDKNTKLSSVDKLNYLIGQTSGDALKIFQSLPLTNENYQVAVNLLKQKFGKPKMMTAALYRRFTDLKPITSETSKLRNFNAEIDCIFGSLQGLGQNINDDVFVSLIQCKLPEQLILTLEQTKSVEDEWTVPTLRKALSDHVERLDATSRATYTTPSNHPRINHTSTSITPLFNGQGSTGATLTANSQARNESTENTQRQFNRTPFKRFAFCEEPHFSDRCTKFTTVEARLTKCHDRCKICLTQRHHTDDCKSTKPCYYCQSRSHHSALCSQQFSSHRSEPAFVAYECEYDVVGNPEPSDFPHPQREPITRENALLATGETVMLQTATAPVKAPHNGREQTATLLLDTAANRSYITDQLAAKLQLKTRPGPQLSVNRFATEDVMTIPSRLAEMMICLEDGSSISITVTIVPKITGKLSRPPVTMDEVKNLVRKLKLADTLPVTTEIRDVDILIGNDYYSDIVTGERLKVCKGLYFIGSKLGWILTGRLPDPDYYRERDNVTMCCFVSSSNPQIPVDVKMHFQKTDQNEPIAMKPQMSDLWSLETIGITEDPMQNDDQRAMDIFHRTIQMKDSRYYVTFPWKDGPENLPDNYRLSLRRLESTVRKLKKQPDLMSKYAEIIEDQRNKGIIEVVDKDTPVGSKLHYIPHHAVVTPTKTTTKVRIVYDGSAKPNKWTPSLNELLLRGPVLIADLCGLLMRFRLSPIALIADIEKAFLQIGLHTDDRDVTRFLWLKDPKKPGIIDNVQVNRFCRVPFGAKPSPFLLNATVQHHLKQYDNEITIKLARDIYVDNSVSGVDTVAEAKKFYKVSKQVFKDASMNLREWCSNSPEFMDHLPGSDQVKPGPQKVLGMTWNPIKDTMSIQFNKANLLGVTTKRMMLSAISTIFDPLGFMLPITIKGKILVQDVCQKNVTWDAPLGSSDLAQWQNLVQQYDHIDQIQIPRCIRSKGDQLFDLLCFCDASSRAYSTAVYLLSKDVTDIKCHLIFAKSRLNPVKKMTIPRLELMALWIGANAIGFVKKSLYLEIKQCLLWSDSQTVLGWISSKKPQGRFIERRIKTIRNSGCDRIRYVSTTDNPADLATRGVSASEMKNLWWSGPAWLLNPKSEWPSWGFNEIDISNLEEKPFGPLHEMSMVAKSQTATEAVFHPPFSIDCAHYSSLLRLFRVTAWCLRFVRKVQRLDTTVSRHLVANELQKAKQLWEQRIQQQSCQSPSIV